MDFCHTMVTTVEAIGADKKNNFETEKILQHNTFSNEMWNEQNAATTAVTETATVTTTTTTFASYRTRGGSTEFMEKQF